MIIALVKKFRSQVWIYCKLTVLLLQVLIKNCLIKLFSATLYCMLMVHDFNHLALCMLFVILLLLLFLNIKSSVSYYYHNTTAVLTA